MPVLLFWECGEPVKNLITEDAVNSLDAVPCASRKVSG